MIERSKLEFDINPSLHGPSDPAQERAEFMIQVLAHSILAAAQLHVGLQLTP